MRQTTEMTIDDLIDAGLPIHKPSTSYECRQIMARIEAELAQPKVPRHALERLLRELRRGDHLHDTVTVGVRYGRR